METRFWPVGIGNEVRIVARDDRLGPARASNVEVLHPILAKFREHALQMGYGETHHVPVAHLIECIRMG
jgi:hypothetical protein